MAIKDFDSDCWGDPWFQAQDRLVRYLFIYLWTNSHCNASGFYVVTLKTMADETKFTVPELLKLLPKLEPKVKYDPDRSVCWVVKHARRQFLKSEKISEQTRKGIRKICLRLCYHPFFSEFIDAYPEIFDPEEKETLYRPPIGGVGGSMRPPSTGQVQVRSGFKEEGVQGEEQKKELAESEKPSLFERFWAIYPKKKSIAKAEKAFLKINPDEQLLEIMISKIERAKKSEDWIKDHGQFIPYPASWLNAKGWEDQDMEPAQKSKTGPATYECQFCGMAVVATEKHQCPPGWEKKWHKKGKQNGDAPDHNHPPVQAADLE